MGTVVLAEQPAQLVQSPLGRGSDRWPRIWPLAVVVLGFPLWWLLGVASFLPFAMALAMAWQLRRHRLLLVPQGMGWWLVFVVWVGFGLFVLYANAPGAVPGGGGGRILVFGYNLGLYLVCTVAALWLVNSTEAELPFGSVVSVLSWFYVFTAAGGLLGVLFPTLDFPSVLEVVLPRSLTQNDFVLSRIHPGLSDIQDVLGTPEPRPKAPFAYANTWGSVVALSLPFFLDAWIRRGSRARRLAGMGILLVSLVPIVYSLNRGLWVCLAAGIGLLVLLQARKGRLVVLLALGASLALAATVLLASPLGQIIGDRLENQHSNDRREQLLTRTVSSAATGSPVIGFGGTRDVQGSFASIAGNSTPDCQACGVPPLGTQGHLWLVVFAQGLVGAALFLMFFLTSLLRTWRCRTPAETLSTTLVLFFLIQMFVYDTLGIPLLLVLMAIGLGWRSARSNGELPVRTFRYWLDSIAARRGVAALLLVAGASVGVAVAEFPKQTYLVSEYVLLSPSPAYLPTSVGTAALPRNTTVDTEAALVMSERTLSQVEGADTAQWRLSHGITVTAVPNTQVLVISVRSEDEQELPGLARRLAEAYLQTRADFLENRRTQLLSTLQARYAELAGIGAYASSAERAGLDEAISAVLLTRTSPGWVLRSDPPAPEGREYLKHIGTGLACGLLVLAVVLEFGGPPRRRPRRR